MDSQVKPEDAARDLQDVVRTMLRAALQAIDDAASTPDIRARTETSPVVIIALPPKPNDEQARRGPARRGDTIMVLMNPSGAPPARVASGQSPDVRLRGPRPMGMTSSVRGPRARQVEHPETDEVIALDGLVIDLGRHRATSNGTPLPLTHRELHVLAVLARRPGRVISPLQILQELGVQQTTPHEAASQVKVYVLRLRRKLVAAGVHSPRVVTVRGVGYMIDTENDLAQQPSPPTGSPSNVRRFGAGPGPQSLR